MSDWEFETKAIHSGINPARHLGATSVPIYETSSFAYDTAQELADVFEGKMQGHVYSRISNPTVSAFEERMNSLENGTGAIATSSGMAAIATILFSLTSQGDEIVTSRSLFGGTFLLFSKIFEKYGIRFVFVDPLDPEELQSAFSDRTRAVFLETIGNPKLDVPDIGLVSDLAEKYDVPLVVDSTLTTPYLLKAKEFGVSLVLHSTTKYITGTGSTIGGVIVDLGNFDWSSCKSGSIRTTAGKVRGGLAFLAVARKEVLQNTGCCLSPFNAYLHSIGLETLALRMERHCSNALELAEFLSEHPGVPAVNYPGLRDNRCFATAEKQFGGRFGGLLTFRLGSREKCFRLIDSLKIAKNLANLGDAKTLIIHPASTIFCDCTDEEMNQAGVSEDLIRVSVGIEATNDIIRDFDQALKEVTR